MLDQLAILLLTGAGGLWAQPAPGAQTIMQLQLEVSGRAMAGCAAQMLAIPVSAGGVIHVEVGGIVYDGLKASSRLLVLRSNEARPLALSGDAVTGGRWSCGVDGRCVGVWHLAR